MKKETETELRARERAIIAGGHRKSVGPQKEDNRPPLHLLLFIAFVNCHPQPVTLLLPLLLLLLGFVFLLPSPLRNRRRSSALASSSSSEIRTAHCSRLVARTQIRRCSSPAAAAICQRRAGAATTCWWRSAARSASPHRVQVTLFAWGSRAVVS